MGSAPAPPDWVGRLAAAVRGEVVTAVVELKPGFEPDASEIIGMCKAELGSVQAPKSVVFRTLPRSGNGKVLKRVLREEYWQGKSRRV